MRYRIVISFGLLIISILIGGISYRSIPQTGLLMSVYGWVKNIESGNSIQGVTINLFKVTDDEKYIFTSEGTSDRNGFYKIKPLEPGIYRFSIELPERGTVYIGFIEFGGGSEDYYKLEIKAGENKNLNIFLGENTIPDIKREEFQNGGRIDFIMIIHKEVESKTMRKSADVKPLEFQQAMAEDTGLSIIQDPNLIVVGEHKQLGYKGNAAGIYKFEFDPEIRTTFKGNTCEFPQPKAIFNGWIEIHSFEWLKTKMNEEREKNELPPHSDDYIRCRYDCLKVHERTHMDLAPKRVKDAWDYFLKKLVPISAECMEECIRWRKQWEERLIVDVEDGIDATELFAKKAQRECDKNCIEE